MILLHDVLLIQIIKVDDQMTDFVLKYIFLIAKTKRIVSSIQKPHLSQKLLPFYFLFGVKDTIFFVKADV